MSTIPLLALIFFLPLALLIGSYNPSPLPANHLSLRNPSPSKRYHNAAYLILSSCLGNTLRARLSNATTRVRDANYSRTYARSFGQAAVGGQGGWEQIEMLDVVDGRGGVGGLEEGDGEGGIMIGRG